MKTEDLNNEKHKLKCVGLLLESAFECRKKKSHKKRKEKNRYFKTILNTFG